MNKKGLIRLLVCMLLFLCALSCFASAAFADVIWEPEDAREQTYSNYTSLIDTMLIVAIVVLVLIVIVIPAAVVLIIFLKKRDQKRLYTKDLGKKQ